jgi:hypothetical protein
MPDYFSRFVMGLLGTICFGLLFEFGFRRSKANHLRVQAVPGGLVVLCFLAWTIYNLVRWRTTP